MSDHARNTDAPTLGRIVLYRDSAPDTPICPAVIVALAETIKDADDVPPLSASGRIHLVVLTPESGVPGGTIHAHDVGEDDHADGVYVEDEQTNGTWRWPDFR